MQHAVIPDNRRASERFPVVLPVQATTGPALLRGTTSNMSSGGACLELEDTAPEIGSAVKLAFAVPGRPEPIEVEAEVRWTAGETRRRCGIMFRQGHQRLLAAIVGGLIGAASMTASANTRVPTFDPNADTVMDLDAGGERPDKQQVLDAFSQQYDAIDQCVMNSKPSPDGQLEGDAHVAVLLNPKGATPLGVNAQLPEDIAKNAKLRECLRSAVARADYPSYDGPPVVVEFDFELDPGFEEVPAE
jgi:hypothetical protein